MRNPPSPSNPIGDRIRALLVQFLCAGVTPPRISVVPCETWVQPPGNAEAAELLDRLTAVLLAEFAPDSAPYVPKWSR